MASHLIYKEGLNWLDSLDSDQAFRIALEYIDAEQTVDRLILDVAGSTLPDKEKLIAILKGAGAKELAESRL